MWHRGKKTQAGVQPGPQDDLRCSFCSKGRAQVAKLIAGPNVYICDECVSLCDDILAEERDKLDAARESVAPQVPRPAARPVISTGLLCALCRFPVEVGGFITIPDRGPLCAACLDAIRAVTGDDAGHAESQ
jgi:hypothetical protein